LLVEHIVSALTAQYVQAKIWRSINTESICIFFILSIN
jgi:hypothetical protein